MKAIYLAGCAVVSLTSASAAFAQSTPPMKPAPEVGSEPTLDANSENGLGEIIVTAQRRSENLQKVPIAITAVSSEQLATSGVKSTQDLQIAVPGLQLLSIGGALTPRLRGVGSGTTGPGLEGAVAVYVDDIYFASGADVAMDLADVEQISVLKGPQGTLFGRNSTGGVIQIRTREPSKDFRLNLATSFDNYETWRSDGYVSGGLTDSLSAGLSVAYITQGQGWGKNLASGRDTYKIDHSISVRGKVKWQPSDRTTIWASADFSDRRGNQALNFRPFPGYNGIIPAPQTDRPWDTNNYRDSFIDYQGGGASLKISQELGFADLVSITGYRNSRYSYAFTPTTSVVPIADIDIKDRSKQFTEELQLVSTGSGPLRFTVGAFYFYNRARSGQTTNIRGPLAAPALLIQQRNPATLDTNSIAGFGQATYSFTPSTRFTAGIRLTYEERKLYGQQFAIVPPGAPVLITTVQDEITSTDPTWRVSVEQDVDPNVTVYASYNRGVKSGGFNTRSLTNPPFKPEKLDDYELGLKSQFLDRRVRLNLAGFYYNYKNIQVPIYAVQSFVLNGASSEIYGLDADFQARVSSRLRLNASANLLHTKFTSFPLAPATIPNPGNLGGAQVSGDASGNRLPYSSKLTYNIGVDYEIPISDGTITLNANDNYNSGYFVEADNRLRQGSYHVLNASIVWAASGSRYSVRAFINNILNEAYVSQAGSVGFSYIADYSNPPRVIGGSLQVAF